MIGSRIAHYQVTGKLGEGAMGEVYQATDTRLKRSVALKMLSPRFGADPDRVARIRREAEVLASLNHAHIGQIYGIEPVGDSFVLVLELVEGPTLEEHLAKGPLPLDRALLVAQQIAAALETAHECGIIHRDLKPANIKQTPEGDVKVLDFGLAKGIHLDGDKTDLTSAGAVIGTPAYMSPEQIDGRALDRRTDIWSFGCVLFEMLTGTKAFGGDSVGSLFAAIATESVDMERIADMPAPVRRLIERCLRKDPKARLRDIGDARVELEEMLAGTTEPGPTAGATPRSRVGLLAVLGTLAGCVVGYLAGALLTGSSQPALVGDPLRPSHYSISLRPAPKTLLLDNPTGYGPPLAISPDGRKVAFAALDPMGARRIYVHNADDGKIEGLLETEGAAYPFFSWDGKYVGFPTRDGDGLSHVALSDRSTQRVLESVTAIGANWSEGGRIVFGHSNRGLVEIPENGGEQEQLTEVADDEFDHRWPQVLPGGKQVLFTVALRTRSLEPRILSIETRDVFRIPVQGVLARFVQNPKDDGTGFLVYVRSNDLWAARIDPAAGKLLGDPVLVVPNIQVSELGNPHLAVAASGTLVFEPQRPPSPGKGVVWVDRKGKTTPLARSGKGYEFPRLSPDGSKVAVAIHTDMASHDVWTIDTRTGTEVKVTSGANYVEPTWSSDGKQLVFSEFWTGNMHTQRDDESTARHLLARAGRQYPMQWHNEHSLIFMELVPGRGFDIAELDPTDGSVRELITSADNDSAGVVSPDGTRLAYVSDETGRPEIYLQNFPQRGDKVPISRQGGTEPVWSADGRELFFRNGLGLFTVRIPERDGERVGEPELLFEGPFVRGFANRPNYDVTSDGQRFVMVEGGRNLSMGRLDVHLHFDEELEALLPPASK